MPSGSQTVHSKPKLVFCTQAACGVPVGVRQVLQQMHQRFPELLPEGHQAAAGTAAGGSAQSSLLPTSHHQR